MGDRQRDPAFEGFLSEARIALHERIEAAGDTAEFIDVVGRAQAIDSSVVSAGASERAVGLAPHPSVAATRDTEFDRFLADVRTRHDEAIAHRRMAPLPPLPVAQRSNRTHVYGAFALLAAGVLAWFAIDVAPHLATIAAEPSAEQSVHLGIERSEGSGGDAVARTPPAKPQHRALAPVAANPPAPRIELEPPQTPAPHREVRKRQPERLQTWLAEAEAAWKANDLSRAERLLRRVIQHGRRSRHAEAAFADLFALAHRTGNETRRRQLWQAYLKRFPKGHYADDARAGLCRQRTGSRRRACWTAYLDAFARGSYRDEARRDLDAQDGGGR